MLLALTLHRPWAWCVAHAGKPIENRDWRPPASVIGKWIAIHSGKSFDQDVAIKLRQSGIDVPGNGGPEGILCVAHLAGFVELENGVRRYPDGELGTKLRGIVERGERWLIGRFGWCFDQVIPLAEPVPCRGAQKLWQVPERETAVVRARFAAARVLHPAV